MTSGAKRSRPRSLSQTRLYFWLQVLGVSKASRVWSPSVPTSTHRAARVLPRALYRAASAFSPRYSARSPYEPEGEDGLGREVDVVGQVAGEVVGAELVLGVEPLLFEVGRPALELGPVGGREVGVAVEPGDGGQQDQHVPGLLDRHLVDLGPLAAAVDLAVGQGVGAQVVRCERELPAARGRVAQHRDQRRLGQRRAEQQEDRRGPGVDHVHGGDAAVAEVLLGEQQGLALRVGHELVRRQGLAIGQGRDPGVLGAPEPGEVGHDLAVEGDRPPDQALIVRLGPTEQVDRGRPVATPVGAEVPPEVGDRVEVVIGEHQVPRDRRGAHLAQVHHEGHHGQLVAGRPGHPEVVPGGQLPGVDERLRAGRIGADRGDGLAPTARRVGVAPVDPQVVPLPTEHGLVLRADPDDLQAVDDLATPGHLLVGRVDRKLGALGEVERDGVLLAVDRPDLPGQVRQRPGQDVEVVRQRGGQEGQGDGGLGALELVDRPRRQDPQAHLGQGGHARRLGPHQPVRLAVDPDHPGERLPPAGPVPGDVVGQPVGARPDAEVGVAGHQGDRGRSAVGESDGLPERRSAPAEQAAREGGQAEEEADRIGRSTVHSIPLGSRPDRDDRPARSPSLRRRGGSGRVLDRALMADWCRAMPHRRPGRA